MGIGPLPSPHMSSGLWIWLLVHWSKNVVVVATVCVTVPTGALSVKVIFLDIYFVRNINVSCQHTANATHEIIVISNWRLRRLAKLIVPESTLVPTSKVLLLRILVLVIYFG